MSVFIFTTQKSYGVNIYFAKKYEIMNIEKTISELKKNGFPVDVATKFPEKYISSGNTFFDGILGGGFARKKITEITGWESTGRTTICLQAALQTQKQNGIVAIVDTHDCLELAQKMNLMADKTFFCDFHTIKELLLCGGIDLLIIDSIAAILMSTAPEEAAFESYTLRTYLDNLNKMSQEIKEICEILKKSQTACIITNQFRFNPKGQIYCYAEKYIEKYLSVRIDVDKVANIPKYTNEGVRANLSIKKNNIHKHLAGKQLEMDIFWGEKQQIFQIIELALTKNIIRFNGTAFVFGKLTFGSQTQDIYERISRNIPLLEQIKELTTHPSIKY